MDFNQKRNTAFVEYSNESDAGFAHYAVDKIPITGISISFARERKVNDNKRPKKPAPEPKVEEEVVVEPVVEDIDPANVPIGGNRAPVRKQRAKKEKKTEIKEIEHEAVEAPKQPEPKPAAKKTAPKQQKKNTPPAQAKYDTVIVRRADGTETEIIRFEDSPKVVNSEAYNQYIVPTLMRSQ